MPSTPSGAKLDLLRRLAASTPALELLLLFGSRARGASHEGSDWDIGYVASRGFDATALLAAIVERLNDDRVDLVDLSRASGLLRYRAARDGAVVFEARPRLAEQFRLDAADFWCDAGPLLQRGYADVLSRLEP